MALVATHLQGPELPTFEAAVPAFGTTGVINSTNDRVAVIMKAPITGTIDRIAFRTGTVTAAETIAVRVESVALANANPTGTPWATNTIGEQPSPASDTIYEVQLTAGAEVTAGDVFAVVFQCDSGSPDLVIATTDAGNVRCFGFPYGALNLTGSYSSSSRRALVAVRYGTSPGYVFVDPNVYLIQSYSTAAVNTGTGATTGTRRGVRFKMPFGVELSGVLLYVDVDGDFDLELYNDAGTLLATLSGQADLTPTVRIDASQTNGWNGVRGGLLRFAPQTLTADTWYRLVITPESASNVTLYEMVVSATIAGMGPFQWGDNFHTTYFDASSEWQVSAITRPLWSLLFTGIDIPAGSARHLAVGAML